MIATASDRLPARVCGPWTREKLAYLQKYAAAFTRAMRGKWRELIYIDLLAGPGLGIDRGSRDEFDGSPLIALKVRPAFDRLFFGDVDGANTAALLERIPADDRARCVVATGDCHAVAEQVVAQLPA